MITSNPHKYWLVSAVDDDPVKCQSFESAVDLAVATRELVEENESRHVYAFCFCGNRLPITKGPERYLIIPQDTPSHYALFGRTGEIADVDNKDGELCAGPSTCPDVGYKTLTDANTGAVEDESDEFEVLDEESDGDLLTEPEIHAYTGD